jgi:hypothetical protein
MDVRICCMRTVLGSLEEKAERFEELSESIAAD